MVVTAAEMGVDYPHRMAGWYEFRNGSVRALGDLHENGGLTHVTTPAVIAPGRIVLAEESPDAFDARPADWDDLIALGVTTALAPIDFTAADFGETLERTLREDPPLNGTLVGRWTAEADEAVLLERLAIAYSHGLVAVLGDPPTARIKTACERLTLSFLDIEQTPTQSSPLPATLDAWLAETEAIADSLGWGDRGRIALGAAADFVLLEPQDGAIDPDCLRGVYVGGTVVRDADGPTVHEPGAWLPRRG